MHKQNRQPCEAIRGLTEYNDVFKKAVKPCLLNNSGNYCSYCDSFYWNDGGLQIEHFKSQANNPPELKIDYNNLYAACGSCNRRKLDNQYPDEEPLRPDDIDYNFNKHFYFEPDTGKILLLNEDDSIAKKTLHFLNLNNIDLKNARKKFCKEWAETEQRPGKSYRFIKIKQLRS